MTKYPFVLLGVCLPHLIECIIKMSSVPAGGSGSLQRKGQHERLLQFKGLSPAPAFLHAGITLMSVLLHLGHSSSDEISYRLWCLPG